MKSIKHVSGKLKYSLLASGWMQRTAGGKWWERKGEYVTLRTAAIREGLLSKEYAK